MLIYLQSDSTTQPQKVLACIQVRPQRKPIVAQCKKPEEYKERQAVTEYVLVLSLVALGVWFFSYIVNPGKHISTLITEVETTVTKVGHGSIGENRP